MTSNDPADRGARDHSGDSVRDSRPPVEIRGRRGGLARQDDVERPVDEFASVTEFVESWLAPTIDRRMTGSRGLVWCPSWWRHREVTTRAYALWRAWEVARVAGGDAMNRWWVHHADPHLRVILDGDTGPVHRCTGRHVDPVPLLVEQVPDGWFGNGIDPDQHNRHDQASKPRVAPTTEADDEGNETPGERVFSTVVGWVEAWLAPTIVRKLPGHGKGATWCTQWWRHREAAVRLHALWHAWETAVASNGSAFSSWWVQGLDPQLKVLLDGVDGPLYRCSPAEHAAPKALAASPVPRTLDIVQEDIVQELVSGLRPASMLRLGRDG